MPDGIPGGYERYLAPTGPNGAYYPQALFVSSRGFGFMLNQPEYSRWRMGNDRRRRLAGAGVGTELDYTVALGPTPRAAVRTLTAINGRHRLPPAWAQGPMLVRAAAVPALPGQPAPETRATYQAKIEQDLADMTRYGVRPSAYAFEGWALLDTGLRARADPAAARARACARSSTTAPTSRTTRSPRRSRATTRRRFGSGLRGHRRGRAALRVRLERRRARPRSSTSSGRATLRWWRARLELLLDAGADGFMQDFGEQVQDGMSFADGSTGRTMHNRYPVIFHRASRRIADAWARRHPERGTPWFFTRSGYSGRPGSAAYEMGNFPGDETADWSAGSGLRSLGPDMLNRAVGGAFGYTTDIGGYVDLLDRSAERRAVHALVRMVGADARTSGCTTRRSTARACPGPTGPRCWPAGRRSPRSTSARYPSSAGSGGAAGAPGCRPRGRCGSRRRRRRAPTARRRSGCSGRTCWWRPWSPRARATGA